MGRIEKNKGFCYLYDDNYNTFPNAIKRKDGTIMVGLDRLLTGKKEYRHFRQEFQELHILTQLQGRFS